MESVVLRRNGGQHERRNSQEVYPRMSAQVTMLFKPKLQPDALEAHREWRTA
jgi:hypothetical protein